MATIPGIYSNVIPSVYGPVYKSNYVEHTIRFDQTIEHLNIEDITIVPTDFGGLNIELYNIEIFHRYAEDGGEVRSYFYYSCPQFLHYIFDKVNDKCKAKIFSLLFGDNDVK